MINSVCQFDLHELHRSVCIRENICELRFSQLLFLQNGQLISSHRNDNQEKWKFDLKMYKKYFVFPSQRKEKNIRIVVEWDFLYNWFHYLNYYHYQPQEQGRIRMEIPPFLELVSLGVYICIIVEICFIY